jgi:hypothetical protein
MLQGVDAALIPEGITHQQVSSHGCSKVFILKGKKNSFH